MKYVGKTPRSSYERLKEHMRDFENLSIHRHMLKHFIDKHKNIERKKLRFGIKVLKLYTSAFERQIGETVWINNYLRDGVVLMNSRNEYNRCIIRRLKKTLDKDEEVIEFEEDEREREINIEIHKMKEELRYEKDLQKSKRIKLDKKKKN